MDVRAKMVEWRKERGLELSDLSRRSGISAEILGMVERGGVTHPIIVERISKLYELSDEEGEMLMPKIYRSNDPEYEPDKFKVTPVPFSHSLPPNNRELVDVYICEHQDRQARLHGKRGNY